MNAIAAQRLASWVGVGREQAAKFIAEQLEPVLFQERQELEAELAEFKKAAQTNAVIDVISENAQLRIERDRAKASHYCTCGKEHRPSGMAGTDVIDAPGHPLGPDCRFLTWEEVAKENQTKALEWRKVAKDREREVAQAKAQALAELREAVEKLPRFDCEEEEGDDYYNTRSATMVERDDGLHGDWLRHSDVLSTFNQEGEGGG